MTLDVLPIAHTLTIVEPIWPVLQIKSNVNVSLKPIRAWVPVLSGNQSTLLYYGLDVHSTTQINLQILFWVSRVHVYMSLVFVYTVVSIPLVHHESQYPFDPTKRITKYYVDWYNYNSLKVETIHIPMRKLELRNTNVYIYIYSTWLY